MFFARVVCGSRFHAEDAAVAQITIEVPLTNLSLDKGSGAGSGGQLRYANYGDNYVIVEADWQGDGVADMQIFVNGTTFMNASDFVL